MVLALGIPGAASAATDPAASQITAPANNSYLSANLDTDPNKTVTVTGTATDASNNPYTGTVDLDCTAAFGGTNFLFSQGASNVTVTGGNFSTNVKVADLAGPAGNTCVLRAVPHDSGGAVPADVTPYAGPNLAIGFYDGKDKLIASGPNAGKQYDYLLAGQGFSGQIEPLTSAGDVGARNLGTVAPAPDDTPAQGITFAAATLWNNPSFSDGTKSSIVVDGKNAYTPSSIANPSSELYSGSNAKSGFQPLQATGYSVDPSTGSTTLVETNPLVRCVTPNPGDPDPGPRGASTNPASATNCPSFTDAGVRLVRTITYDHDGAQLYFQDSFQSTDAAQHSIDLRYFNGLQPPASGTDADTKYKFDWSGADQGNPPHTYSGGDSVAASPVGINTIDILANGGSQTSPSGTLYSRAAITFSGATSGAKFFSGDEYSFELNFLNRTVPATGSLKMNMAYSIAPDQATLDPLVAAAQVRVAQPPVVTTSAGSTAYTEGAAATPVDGSVTVTDPDSANLSSAQVRISSGFEAGDTLGFANQNGISGSYNAGTGVLTLSGSAAVSDYQTALQSVTYSTGSNQNPSTSKTVEFKANDGTADSNLATKTLAITPVNTAPTVTTSGGQASYSEGSTPVQPDPAVNVTDPDSAQLKGATVSITGNFTPSDGDTLSFTNTANITGTYDAGTGVLTLSGNDTVANYQDALRSVMFSFTSQNPSTATRTVSFQATDTGNAASNTATRNVGVSAVNNAPTVTTTGSNLSYTEGDGPVAADPGLAVSDPDSAQLQGATVSVTGNFVAADDSLGFTNQSGITGSYDAGTGVLTLSGNASVANYQAALRTVTYQNSSENPSGTKTLSFQATDTAGAASNVATRGVTLTGANDAPTVTTTAGNTAYTQGGPSVTVDSGATASDVDSANLASAQVRISAGFQAGDSLDFGDQNGISGSYNAATGVLTLSGSASVANYQAALRSIKYATTNPTPSASKTVEFKVNDGALDSNAATKGIAVTAVNSAPTVTTSGGSTAYTENAAPTVVDAAVTVTDPDSATLQSARVRISVGFESTDVLSFTNQNGISGSYDAGTGVMTLTGASTVVNYQAALRDVKFNSTSDNPGTSKTVEFTANDGVADSNAATKDLVITRVDDPPVAADDSAQIAENASATNVDVLANDSDVDGGSKQVVSVTQPAHGTSAVTGGGTGVSYQPAANYCNSQQGGAPDTFQYTLNGGSQANVSISVTCAGTAAKPVVTVTKRLAPTTDPGRFDLKVNGAVVKAAAGNGGHGSTPVDSGSDVTVSEAAANGHPLGDYRTAIDCGTAGSGAGASLTLTHVTADISCTVTNTRRAVPRGRLTISHHDTTVTRGHTLVRLFCHGATGARCGGTLHLEPTVFTTRLHHAAATSSGPSVRFNLAAGKDKSYAVQVPKETRTQLARKHKAIARAVARLSDGRSVTLLITLISH